MSVWVRNRSRLVNVGIAAFAALAVSASGAAAQSGSIFDIFSPRATGAARAPAAPQPGQARQILRAPRADARESNWDDPFDAAGAGTTASEEVGASAAPVVNTVPVLSSQTLGAMDAAIARYRQIAATGGWRQVPGGKTLQVGSRDPRVAALRERLMASGDLFQSRGSADVFDSYVQHAVARFQRRNGLRATGLVDERSLSALNVPAEARLAQLELNRSRIAKQLPKLANRFVMVNIPGAEIEAVSSGVVERRHRTVVGKVDRQTPLVTSKISQLNFHPYWHVPESIVRKDLVPQLRNDLDYLERTNLRVFTDWSFKNEVDPRTVDWSSPAAEELKFRQEPGDGNALGHVKINFANSHAVYLHDTPKKALFGQELRADSSGCVRVQNVEELVMWLLQENGDWDRARLDQVISDRVQMDENLSRGVALYMVYVTAWATDDGTVHFRRDLYERDGVGRLAANY